MRKKLLAILGSPHTEGSTAAMLDCAIEAAAQAGWEVERVNLYQKHIAYCRGCNACCSAGSCVISDDLQEIAGALLSCDMVALAAPTYWANVPAVVKNLFDRLFGTVLVETATFPQPRQKLHSRCLLLTACNTPFPFSGICKQSSGALRAMKEFFRYSGIKCAGCVTFSGAKGKASLPPSICKKIRRYWP